MVTPKGFVSSHGPFPGISTDMSAAAPWDLGFAVGANLRSCQHHFTISVSHMLIFAVTASLVMPLQLCVGSRQKSELIQAQTDSFFWRSVILTQCAAQPCKPLFQSRSCPWRGQRSAVWNQVRGAGVGGRGNILSWLHWQSQSFTKLWALWTSCCIKWKGNLNQLSMCINCGNPYVVLRFLQQH